MNLDDFKPDWQQRQRDLDGNVDHVIEKVRSRMSSFDRAIWRRDMYEVIGLVLLALCYSVIPFLDFFQPENNWLCACGAVMAVLFCVFAVAIYYWARTKGKVARKDLPFEDFCKAELARVDRQIWLMKNIHWWYLGPMFIAVAVQSAGIRTDLKNLIFLLTFILPLLGIIWWLIQVAVRVNFRPLRNELVRAIDADEDDTSIFEDSLQPSFAPKKLPWRERIIGVCGMLLALAISVYLAESVDVNRDAPRLSPFTEMRFEESQIIVTYQEQAYQWLELDGIQVEDITSTAKFYYWGRWQKRVREDLGDVLWKMGHQPGDTVELRLRNLETSQQQVFEDAPVTKDNRRSIERRADDEAADKARYPDELTEDELENVSIDQALRARLVGRYELSPTFIFDVQDRDGRLMLGVTNQQTREVFPDSASRWSCRDIDATIEFKLTPSGPAKRLILHQDGKRKPAIRIDE